MSTVVDNINKLGEMYSNDEIDSKGLASVGDNVIINGEFRINQTGSVSVSTTAAPYGADQWLVVGRSGATLTFATATSDYAHLMCGNRYFGYVNVASAKTPATSDHFALEQLIEGHSIAHFKAGTVNAKTVKLSFATCNSIAGEYSVYLRNPAVDRSYVTTYTQQQANVWEHHEITIPMCMDGTWGVDTAIGMGIGFDVGSGSDFETSAVNTWITGIKKRTAASVKLVSTANANLRITNVSLALASSGAYAPRPYAVELGLCQRYYEVIPYAYII